MDCTSVESTWSLMRVSSWKYINRSIFSLKPQVPLAKTLEKIARDVDKPGKQF